MWGRSPGTSVKLKDRQRLIMGMDDAHHIQLYCVQCSCRRRGLQLYHDDATPYWVPRSPAVPTESHPAPAAAARALGMSRASRPRRGFHIFTPQLYRGSGRAVTRVYPEPNRKPNSH